MARPEEGASRGHELRGTAIVRELRRRGRLKRSALASEFATAGTTLEHTVKLLLESGAVLAEGRSYVRLNPDLGILVGVDVARNIATVAISDMAYNFLNSPDAPQSRVELPMRDPQQAILRIAELVATQLGEHFVSGDVDRRLVGIGITLPGPVSREPGPDRDFRRAAAWDRRVKAGPILPGWDDLDVPAELANALKMKHGLQPPRHNEKRRFVWLENDASAGALGVHTELKERYGEDAPDDLIYVRIADGIGAGIISKGHLLTGAHGYAGELGHITVVPGGSLCVSCGGRGCLETVASGRTVAGQLAPVARSVEGQHRGDSNNLTDLLTASNHPAVARALRDAGWHTGSALSSICCFLNPAWVVFGGAMAEYRTRAGRVGESRRRDDEQRPFMSGVWRALEASALPQAKDRLEIKTWNEIRGERGLRVRPELLGALALALDHLGDAYLLPPIGQWLRGTTNRSGTLSFA